MRKAARKELGALIETLGCADWKWLDPKDIVVAQWVRMKCAFGCGEFGHNAACPPNVPSVEECRKFFEGYETAVILHFPKKVEQPDDRHEWTKEVNKGLLALEREVFLARYHKAFLLAMDSCGLCAECTEQREKCKQPKVARPTPEAMAVDVYATVRKFGFAIQVLRDTTEEMNRYAFPMIE